MDIINVETNKILFSKHTPETEFDAAAWVRLQDVDFTGVGVADVSTSEGKTALRRVARGSYVIENLVARWKTEEVLYDLEAARTEKIRELNIRTITLIEDRAGDKLGSSEADIRALFAEFGDRTAQLAATLALVLMIGQSITVSDILSQYSDILAQIKAATSKEELDAITIP